MNVPSILVAQSRVDCTGSRSWTGWTGREIADEMIKRGIVDKISTRHASRLLKKKGLKPHLFRYWLTTELDEDFDEKVEDINALYRLAPELAPKGEIVMSTDEMTGVQALERKHPGQPMLPAQVERGEFEYSDPVRFPTQNLRDWALLGIRRGTLSFIVNFEVASGQVATVSCSPTRTEADFLKHIQRSVESRPSETR